MKNALVFCSHPVIYVQSPDCLDPIQLSMGHALRNTWGLVPGLAPGIGPHLAEAVVTTHRQRGGWECTVRVLLLGKCRRAWFPHGQNSIF